MRRRRPKSTGFTLIETLISIAILAIALTGVLAALAYDAFASGQSGNYTFAVNYSRKLMDLLQSGQIDIVGPAGTGQYGAQNLVTPPALDSTPGNTGTDWHNLDGGGVGSVDDVLRTGNVGDNFWGIPGSSERKHFEVEKLKYGVNYCWHRMVPLSEPVANRYKNQLVEIIVTTRWQMRRGFRSVQLRSYYVTTAG